MYPGQARAIATEARRGASEALDPMPTHEALRVFQAWLERSAATARAARERAEGEAAARLPLVQAVQAAEAPLSLAAAREQARALVLRQVRPFARGQRQTAAPQAADASAAECYLGRDGQTYGPYGWEQLQEFARSGRLAATDLVWLNGWPEWVQAAQVPGLFAPSEAS